VLYKSYEALEKDYAEQKIHPKDLKKAVAKSINKLIEPVRNHFQNDPFAK
jgi:tyrosyl-tRNA synthetase